MFDLTDYYGVDVKTYTFIQRLREIGVDVELLEKQYLRFRGIYMKLNTEWAINDELKPYVMKKIKVKKWFTENRIEELLVMIHKKIDKHKIKLRMIEREINEQ